MSIAAERIEKETYAWDDDGQTEQPIDARGNRFQERAALRNVLSRCVTECRRSASRAVPETARATPLPTR